MCWFNQPDMTQGNVRILRVILLIDFFLAYATRLMLTFDPLSDKLWFCFGTVLVLWPSFHFSSFQAAKTIENQSPDSSAWASEDAKMFESRLESDRGAGAAADGGFSDPPHWKKKVSWKHSSVKFFTEMNSISLD